MVTCGSIGFVVWDHIVSSALTQLLSSCSPLVEPGRRVQRLFYPKGFDRDRLRLVGLIALSTDRLLISLQVHPA
jgi:hypothetical protein